MSAMTVKYVEGSWAHNRRAPTPQSRWIEQDEAQELYAAGRPFLVVDADRLDEKGRVHPRWVIGFGRSVQSGVRVQFFDALGRFDQIIDYTWLDGRLWRASTSVYSYADDERFYLQNQATSTQWVALQPDGTGVHEFRDNVERVVERSDIRGAEVDGCWLDRPAFGDWADLCDPYYGVPGLTAPGLR